MSAAVFVDSNVLVYARQANEPVKQPLAATWLERLWRAQLGRTSVQELSETYVTLTHKIDPAFAAADAWGTCRLSLRGIRSPWMPPLHGGRAISSSATVCHSGIA